MCLGTDKAAYPVNAMGMSKAMMEKVAQAFARNNPTARTVVSTVRYGNVMMSRGSVIPMFVEQVKAGVPMTVTDPSMTRFLMSLDEAVRSGRVRVRARPARRPLRPQGAGEHGRRPGDGRRDRDGSTGPSCR